jgi:hypothetical protein
VIAALAPLDAMRAALLRVAGRPGRVFLARRPLRVGAYAAFGLSSTLLLALVAPLWAYALGPIVLGVPHLMSDVRYLVAKPRLHARPALAIAAGVPIFVSAIANSPAIGLAAGLGAIACARASLARRIPMFVACAAIVLYASMHARLTQLVLLHGHNAVAVILFFAAFARSRRVGIAVAAAFAAVMALVLGGAFDGIVIHTLAHGPRSGADVGGLLDTIAPLKNPVMAMRLAISFIVAQGFHYVLWLRVVPEEARERPGVRSFASSFEALEKDIGRVVIFLFVGLAVLVLARAAVSLEGARLFYLRIASFHAHLEIAFALLVLLEGRPKC